MRETDTMNTPIKKHENECDTEMKKMDSGSGSARGKAVGVVISNNLSSKPTPTAINETKVGDTEKSHEEVATVSKTSAIILILALGVHAFFEGIAFGLLTSISAAG